MLTNSEQQLLFPEYDGRACPGTALLSHQQGRGGARPAKDNVTAPRHSEAFDAWLDKEAGKEMAAAQDGDIEEAEARAPEQLHVGDAPAPRPGEDFAGWQERMTNVRRAGHDKAEARAPEQHCCAISKAAEGRGLKHEKGGNRRRSASETEEPPGED